MRVIDKGSSITKVNKVDKLLDDYGIKDISTLKYILDQYQKVIVNITKNKMSYLTYPAETILSVVSDIYNENLEKEIDDLNTELSEYRQNAIVFKPELMYTLKECEPKLEEWHNENPTYQNLQEIRYRAAKAEYDKIMKVLNGWGIKNEVSAIIKQLENEIDELKTENEALHLLIEWAEECDFGYDNFPEEYEKYKDEIEGMGYIEGMIHIAKRACQQKRGADNETD